MSISISGSVRFESNNNDESVKLDRIYIYLSKHVPCLKLSAVNVLGNEGRFVLTAALTTAHRFGRKAADRSKIAIPVESFLGIEILGLREADDGDGSIVVAGDTSTYAGDYELGTTQLTLSSCFMLQNSLKARGYSWNKTVARVPVIDEYTITQSIDRGWLVVEDLSIQLDKASFEGRALTNKLHCNADDGDREQQGKIDSFCDSLLAGLIPSSATQQITDLVYNRYDTLDMKILELANASIATTFDNESTSPALSILSSVHCPYYKQARNFNVGPAYALSMPIERSDELFFERCIKATLARFAVDPEWFVNVVEDQVSYPSTSESLAIGFPLAYALAGMALTTFCTASCYSDDRIMIPTQKRAVDSLEAASSDRYSDLRKLGTDDCEGDAREIVLEHRELLESRKNGSLNSRLVRAYADALRWSIPMLAHGLARTGDLPKQPKKTLSNNMHMEGEEDGAPSVLTHPLNPFYYGDNGGEGRKRAIVVMEESTASPTQNVASAHCFIILDTTNSFLECLSSPAAIEVHQLAEINLNDAHFKGQPSWVKKLPRLILEGTNYVFPVQFPLGLLYQPKSKERLMIELFQFRRRQVLNYLTTKFPGLSAFTTVKYGLNISTSASDVLVQKWDNTPKDFYWMVVAAYVPTVCAPIPDLPNNSIRDDRALVFREVAFMSPDRSKYGVMVSDLVLPQGKKTVVYVPTSVWLPHHSDLVTNQDLAEGPIPPIKITMTQNERQEKLAKQFEENLLSALPGGGKWVNIKRMSKISTVSTDTGTEGIPPGSDFYTSNNLRLVFHLHEGHIVSAKVKELFMQVVGDKDSKVQDVKVFAINLGSPSSQGRNDTYVYDVVLETNLCKDKM